MHIDRAGTSPKPGVAQGSAKTTSADHLMALMAVQTLLLQTCPLPKLDSRVHAALLHGRSSVPHLLGLFPDVATIYQRHARTCCLQLACVLCPVLGQVEACG
jgi:hypothetical protein